MRFDGVNGTRIISDNDTNPTDFVDLQWRGILDWTAPVVQELLAKFENDPNRVIRWELSSGTLSLVVYDEDGAPWGASRTLPTLTANVEHQFRTTINTYNGVLKFFSRATDADPWAQLGVDAVVGLRKPLRQVTAFWKVSDLLNNSPQNGLTYSALVYDDIADRDRYETVTRTNLLKDEDITSPGTWVVGDGATLKYLGDGVFQVDNFAGTVNDNLIQAFAAGSIDGRSFWSVAEFRATGSDIGKSVRLRTKRGTGGTNTPSDTNVVLTGDWEQWDSGELTGLASNADAQFVIRNPSVGTIADSFQFRFPTLEETSNLISLATPRVIPVDTPTGVELYTGDTASDRVCADYLCRQRDWRDPDD